MRRFLSADGAKLQLLLPIFQDVNKHEHIYT